jgi:hypothetical protein
MAPQEFSAISFELFWKIGTNFLAHHLGLTTADDPMGRRYFHGLIL